MLSSAYRNPDVANRVRVLTIWPHVLHSAIHSVARPRLEQVRPPPRGFSRIFRLLCARRGKTLISTTDSTTTPEDLLEQRYHSVALAAQGLTKVEEAHIQWYNVNGREDFPDETLFDAIQPVFGSSLRTLVLDMPLTIFTKARTFFGELGHIQELDLTLYINRAGADPKLSHEEAFANVLLPFINGLSSTLRILSITIHHHSDLSPFFRGLGHFPRLTRLSLTLPLDIYHIPDPSGFNQLLSNHPDLQELGIQHQSCCRHYDLPHNSVGIDWVQRCFQGISFTGLRRLSLGLTSTIHLTFVNSMRTLAQTLTTITLTEPCLHYRGLAIVLTALATPRLRTLSLFIHVLSPQLLVLLAEKCPNLERLDLSIEKCHSSEGSAGEHDEVSDAVWIMLKPFYKLPLFLNF
jgi:hypothetical protein